MHYPGVAEALDMRHEGENVGFLKEMKIIFKKRKRKKHIRKEETKTELHPGCMFSVKNKQYLCSVGGTK